MPAPLLRQNKVLVTGANTWTAVHSAVPASRAFVVSKIVVANNGAATTFHLAVGSAASPASADLIALSVSLPVGSVYTETGIVVPTGSFVSAFTTVANAIVVNVFGEEVDN